MHEGCAPPQPSPDVWDSIEGAGISGYLCPTCLAATVCGKCGLLQLPAGADARMILCASDCGEGEGEEAAPAKGCERPFHLACYSLTDVPEGDWFDCVFTAEVAAVDRE